MGIEGFLADVHKYTYQVSEQIFDSLGGKLDIQVITVEQYLAIDNEDNPEYYERIHNTKFHL